MKEIAIKKECLDHLVKSIECQYGKQFEIKIEREEGSGKERFVIKDKNSRKLKVKLIHNNDTLNFELQGFSDFNKVEEMLGKLSYFSVKVLGKIVKVESSNNYWCSGLSIVSELLCILIAGGAYE